VLEKTTFTGALANEDRFTVLQQAEVFALPSYTENFGQVVCEAMASGVPVVISDQVNIWPEVARSEAGLVVPAMQTRPRRRSVTFLTTRHEADKWGATGVIGLRSISPGGRWSPDGLCL